MLLVRRRLALRAFVAALIGTARHVGTTAAMSSAAAAMQRKTIALALVTIRLLSLRRRTGDERWQTIDRTVLDRLSLRLTVILARFAIFARLRLLTRLIGLALLARRKLWLRRLRSEAGLGAEV